MYESERQLHLELSFPHQVCGLNSVWSFVLLLTFWYLRRCRLYHTMLQVHQEGGNVLSWISHSFITQRLFWDAAALRLGKYMNSGLMRFTVHMRSTSIAQCVEDVLLICRSADWLHRVWSMAGMSQIYWIYWYIDTAYLLCVGTVAICLGLLDTRHLGWSCSCWSSSERIVA